MVSITPQFNRNEKKAGDWHPHLGGEAICDTLVLRIPTTILNDPNLLSIDKVIFSLIDYFGWKNLSKFFGRDNYLCKKLFRKKRTIQWSLKRLEERGYIFREHIPEKNYLHGRKRIIHTNKEKIGNEVALCAVKLQRRNFGIQVLKVFSLIRKKIKIIKNQIREKVESLGSSINNIISKYYYLFKKNFNVCNKTIKEKGKTGVSDAYWRTKLKERAKNFKTLEEFYGEEPQKRERREEKERGGWKSIGEILCAETSPKRENFKTLNEFYHPKTNWQERFKKLIEKIKKKKKKEKEKEKKRENFEKESSKLYHTPEELWQIAQRKIEKVRLYWKLLTKKSK